MYEGAIWELAAEGGMAALDIERLRKKIPENPHNLRLLYPKPVFMVLSLMTFIHQQALGQKTDASMPLHDRLTEIVMGHLDASLVYRPAIARLWDDLVLMPLSLLTLRPYLVKIVKRILHEAGLQTNDTWSALRTPAYTTLFLYVLYIWMYDESPQQEQTLVTLDKGLKQLEKLTW